MDESRGLTRSLPGVTTVSRGFRLLGESRVLTQSLPDVTTVSSGYRPVESRSMPEVTTVSRGFRLLGEPSRGGALTLHIRTTATRKVSAHG